MSVAFKIFTVPMNQPPEGEIFKAIGSPSLNREKFQCATVSVRYAHFENSTIKIKTGHPEQAVGSENNGILF